jgi:multicomponent Na+:H+ antiporter subunit G
LSAAAAFAGLCLIVGCAFFLAGTVGLLRFPDTLTRLHATVKADNLGLGFICLGLAVHDGTLPGAVRLFAVWLLALVGSAISAFLIARHSLTTSRAAAPDPREKLR